MCKLYCEENPLEKLLLSIVVCIIQNSDMPGMHYDMIFG